MKKFLLVMVLIVFINLTFATDIPFRGSFRTRTIDYKKPIEGNFSEYGYDTIGVIDSRFRLYTNAVFSDNLKAVLGLEVGDFDWGDESHNHDLKNVETKRAMLVFSPDFLSNVTFKAGLQGYTDQFQAAVFDEDIAGLVIKPDFKALKMTAGIFNFIDVDVLAAYSHTLGIIDLSRKFSKFKIKGSIYYDNIRNEQTTTYFGGGADYKLASIDFGGHLLYMTRNYQEDGAEDITGYFLYSYGEYTMDKLGFRVNFGYTPSDDTTYFEGIEPYAEGYELEYAYPGSVNDSNSLIGDYGTEMGQMVVSSTLNYDFAYVTFGMIKAANSNTDDKDYGNELDIGIKKELTDGLTFKAVYAIFMPEDLLGKNVENAHEFSTQFKYKF